MFTLNIHTFALYLILLFKNSTILPVSLCKSVEGVANSEDPDQTSRSVASDLGLHCFLRSVSRRGAFNEYPQHMFLSRNKKNNMWIPPLICSYGKV